MIPKILGITDEQTSCDCCGRADLKRTVVLDFDGEIKRYGTACAQRAAFPYLSPSQIKTIAQKRQWARPV